MPALANARVAGAAIFGSDSSRDMAGEATADAQVSRSGRSLLPRYRPAAVIMTAAVVVWVLLVALARWLGDGTVAAWLWGIAVHRLVSRLRGRRETLVLSPGWGVRCAARRPAPSFPGEVSWSASTVLGGG
jgi:hypothetical protein